MFTRRSFVITLCTRNKNHYRSKYEWVAPVGHDTGIQVYHEIAKKKVPLIFPNPKYVKWYMCGPTVYDAAHIGHACCYVRSDIIRRVLREYYNIDAVVAIGVTNISEKILERSEELKKNVKDLTKKYETEFFAQMEELNVLPASMILRVSDHLPVLSSFILKLVEKGAAYKTVDGSIYFKTTAHSNYGRFKTPEVVTDTDRVPGKLSPLDFALWKSSSSKSFKNQQTKGLPGWHIQCSAMASHVFGDSLDIHSGGADLIFPHHENEESQSTSYHDCQQWVNYWFHTGLINMGEEKMSKSLKNYLSISKFLENNSSDHLRMFCTMSQYRKSSIYSPESVALAVNICDRVIRFLNITNSYTKGTWILGDIREAELLEEIAKSHEVIKTNLSNDFGVHEALKSILVLIKKATQMLNDKTQNTTSRSPAVIASLQQHVNKFFNSLGFIFAENAVKNEVPSALEALIDATVNFRIQIRERILPLDGQRQKKLLALCDESRDNLESIGVIIDDISPSHTSWAFKNNKVNNGSTVKNVIDILVWFRAEVQKLLPSLLSHELQNEVLEICRYTKMHLSTLGVMIEDFSDGRSYWTFPKADNDATSKFEVMINSTLKFYVDIRNVALSITDGNSAAAARENILALCDTATSNLQSYGVILKDVGTCTSDWMLEINNKKGKSIVQNIMDMLMGSREQVKSLAITTSDLETRSKLENICQKTKKFLTNYGIYISESRDCSNSATWCVDVKMNNKIFVKNLLDVLVIFMDEVKRAAEPLKDTHMKNILLEICRTLEGDLKEIGVILVSKGSGTKWTFKDCKFLWKHENLLMEDDE